jgi:hypothetical protein
MRRTACLAGLSTGNSNKRGERRRGTHLGICATLPRPQRRSGNDPVSGRAFLVCKAGSVEYLARSSPCRICVHCDDCDNDARPHCCAVKNAPHRDSTGIYAKAFFCPPVTRPVRVLPSAPFGNRYQTRIAVVHCCSHCWSHCCSYCCSHCPQHLPLASPLSPSAKKCRAGSLYETISP